MTETQPYVLAAKNIRAELKTRFPGVKFSIRSHSYANGDSVYVTWVGGPKEQEIYPLVEKYEQGSFDGMTDSYVHDEDPQHKEFHRLRGSTKYVVLQQRRAA